MKYCQNPYNQVSCVIGSVISCCCRLLESDDLKGITKYITIDIY